MITTKRKAAALTTAQTNIQQKEVYSNIDDKSRDFQKHNAISMAAMILLRSQAGYYTPSQQKGVWPMIDALLRSHVGGGQNA